MKERSFSLTILNGPLEDSTLLPFLDDLVESGYQGVCFHPRDGMLAPYGSRYYWERLDSLIGAARRRNLAVWFYDEFPYPSGIGGGPLIEDNPQARAQTLVFEQLSTQTLEHSGEPGLIDLGTGNILGVVRYRLKEGQVTELREVSDDCGGYFDTWVWGPWHNRFYTGTLHVHEEAHERASADRWTRVYRPDVPLESDEHLLVIKIKFVSGQKGLSGHPDLTLPEVTDKFLDTIYRPLAKISERHGMEATPVFQDEVGFGSLHPWNREISARLRGVEHPAVTLAKSHLRQTPDWEYCRYLYRKACAEALEENWFARVATYCNSNNLRMTGHIAGEESILGHAALMGDAFQSLKHFDIPGYDLISAHYFDEQNRGQATGIKLVQGVAWINNRPISMAEIFACNGFQSNLNSQRSILAWLALHDFTRTFDHSTYSCALSVRKYDAPPVSNRFNPLNVGRAELWEWQCWFCDLLEEYKFSPQTLVLFSFDALTRYCLDEEEIWREPVKRLENWFFETCGNSLDCIFLPSHLLDEVEITDDGFLFNRQLFQRFLVPPFESLHSTTFAKLERLAPHHRFSSFTQNLVVFGDENNPLQQRTLPSRLEVIEDNRFRAARPFLQSRRHHEDGEVIQVLLNPHDEPLEIRCDEYPGSPIAQPPLGFANYPLYDGGDWLIRLSAGETLVLNPNLTPVLATPTQNEELLPIEATWRCTAKNQLSLKNGTIILEGFEKRDFEPAPVSSLWHIPQMQMNHSSHAVYAPLYSWDAFSSPLQVEACFDVILEERLTDLVLVLDEASLPPNSQIYWNENLLPATTENYFDRGNTVFHIPPEELKSAKHKLVIRGNVNSGAQGVLERPILVGDFAVFEDREGLCFLRDDWQLLPVDVSWKKLGLPEGFGPIQVRLVFDIPDEGMLSGRWELRWPSFHGVALIRVNDGFEQRSCFEPRIIPITDLHTGKNSIKAQVYGSWNNVFSLLNRTENGWSGIPFLRRFQ